MDLPGLTRQTAGLSGAFRGYRTAETLSMEQLVPWGVGPPLSVSVPTTAPEWTP